MAAYDLTPIIVGVGDVVNRSREVKDAAEPKDLMLAAIHHALQDASSTSLQSNIDSIDVVACWTWPYEDLPGLIADGLKVQPLHKHIPKFHGGNQPAKLVDEAAKRISLGKCKVAVVCGGESLASLAAYAQAKMLPPPGWTPVPQDVTSVFSASDRKLKPGLGALHQIGAPIQVYPLYENAFRAHRGQSLSENHRESAELYARFAEIAESNPLAWNYGKPAKRVEEIGTISKSNRMICFPYPLLMNAFNSVNIAGACILTSVGLAQKLGIPKERWIFPLGGAGTRDSYDFWERPDYHSSPCISRSLDAAIRVSGITQDDIDLYDLYSCFPIVPKLACEHLKLSSTNPAKPITLLGGLTSFGGAGNNYSMHALTEMVRHLRQGKAKTGLVLANGGVVTYQHAICLSSQPRRSGAYPVSTVLPDVVNDISIPSIETRPDGPATIETYTVDFDRDGKPLRGHIVGRLANGKRFLANHGDESTLSQLASWTREPIGRVGIVSMAESKDRNLFSFMDEAKL